MKTIPIFLLLVVLTGCERPSQRFVPASPDVSGVLVDTKTGRLCDGGPPERHSGPLPLCYDLYKGK